MSEERASAALRAVALAATPGETGIGVPPTENGVWGVIADLGFANGGATVVAFVDGSASVYWGASGGIIGGKAHENVRSAAQAAALEMEACVASMSATGVHELPGPGHVRLYAHCRAGLLSSEELAWGAVAKPDHPLAGCFSAVNDVITQLRRVSDAGS